jgi:hypothetical protein
MIHYQRILISRYTKEFRIAILEAASPTPNVQTKLGLSTIPHFKVNMSKISPFFSIILPEADPIRPIVYEAQYMGSLKILVMRIQKQSTRSRTKSRDRRLGS